MTALNEKDVKGFYQSIKEFMLIVTVGTPIFAAQDYVEVGWVLCRMTIAHSAMSIHTFTSLRCLKLAGGPHDRMETVADRRSTAPLLCE